MDPTPRKARYYLTLSRRSPFREWRDKLDSSVAKRVNIRIRRIEELGNYGDCNQVGGGVHELRIDIGPGYRVYFGIDKDRIILLAGGDKSTQVSDIKKAQACWGEYNA